MSRKAPSPAIVIDANIILSAVLGRRSRPVLDAVMAERFVMTSVRAEREMLGRAAGLSEEPRRSTELAASLLTVITVVDGRVYESRLEEAAEALRLAVASRNGSVTDAHILALAWEFDADIWSHDRDFAGTGWPSWSNANLAAALRAGPAR